MGRWFLQKTDIYNWLYPQGYISGDNRIYVQQYKYEDETNDVGVRTYIYGSTKFKLADDALFIIDPESLDGNGNVVAGTRHIENYAIEPMDDNFDFQSSNGITNVLESALINAIDPWEIGRTVNIKFDNLEGLNRIDYTETLYNLEKNLQSDYHSNLGGGLVASHEPIQDLANRLFENGVTKFVDNEGRPIVYGTNNADTLSVATALEVDRLETPLVSNIGMYNHSVLAPFVIGGATKGVVLIGGKGNDTITGGNLQDKLLGGDDDDLINGDDGDDYIEGNLGNDTLLGGDNADKVYGGMGSDILYGDDNELADSLIGGNDTLYGGADDDQLYGEGGDDTLYGEADNDTLYGGYGDDQLYGGTGADHLDGGLGADTLQGGANDDTYLVDNTGDLITELANEGTDLVQSSISYTLTAHVEHLTLTGTAHINGTGNALNNTLIGNSGNDPHWQLVA